jgi:hypothetical protein
MIINTFARLKEECGELSLLEKELYWTDSKRMRSIVKKHAKYNTIHLKFKIDNKLKEPEVDVDGKTRYGVIIWFGYKNRCNHYQLYWRYQLPDRKTYIGVQVKSNKGRSDSKSCAGIGYRPLGKFWKLQTEVDILDGEEHTISIRINDTYDFTVFCDGLDVLHVVDKLETFDSNKFGFRSDNVSMEFKPYTTL